MLGRGTLPAVSVFRRDLNFRTLAIGNLRSWMSSVATRTGANAELVAQL